VALLLGLDPLGDQPPVRGAREAPEANDEGLAGQVVIDAADQADIDLHEVRPQRDDVAEIGDTCAGIVDR
jgi:hypothetical protein